MASLAASRSSLRGIQNIKDVPNIKGTLSNETVRVRLPAEFGGPDASYANATESPSTEHPAGVYTPMPGPRGKWALLGVILAVAAGVIVVIQWPVLSGWFVANDRARSARTPDARNDSPQPPLAAPPAASPTPSSASETPVQAASPGADTKAAAAPEGSTAPNTDAQTGATSAPSTDAVGQGLTQTQQRPNPAAASTAKTDKPEEYPVLLRRAKRAALQKNFKVAEQLYKDALAARPGALEAQSGLGYLALEQGNYASAISYFDTISASGFGEGFIGLGRTYRRMNRRSDALEAFEQYLSRFPSGDLATVARKHVEELSPKAAESASDPTKPGASAPATTPADSSSATPPPLDKTADAGVTP